jgi:hypothetical protein
MAREAIVAAFVQAALDAKQVTRRALGSAKLDGGSEIYHSAIKSPPQFFDTGVGRLESLSIQLQPLIDPGRTQVYKVGQIMRKAGNPFRVVDVLPSICPVPRLTESLEMSFTVCHWSIWSRKQKHGFCVLPFDHQIRIEVLWTSVWSMQIAMLLLPSVVLVRARLPKILSLMHSVRLQEESLHDEQP